MKFFSPFEDILHRKNKLPHWQQPGACYFVTFRLADSIPHSLLESWREERNIWRQHHPEPHSESDQQDYHRRFTASFDRHLDEGHGECLLKDSSLREIVAEALMHFDHDRHLHHAWVIMPNHVHALFSLRPGADISKLIQSWKRHSARQINIATEREGSLWQRDYFDRIIRDQANFANTVRYIRKNAEKARLSPESFTTYEDDLARAVPSSPLG